MKNTNFMIHDFMVEDLGLSGVTLQVYALIYSFTRAGGDCHGSLEYIAQRVGAARASVHRALTQLLAKKFIIKLSKTSKGNCRYKANLVLPSQNETVNESQNEIEVVSKCDGGSLKMILNNKDNNKDDNTTNNHSLIQGVGHGPVRLVGDRKVVMMTLHHFTDLLKRVGVLPTLKYLRKLENYIIDYPERVYKNHYQIILNWAREDGRLWE